MSFQKPTSMEAARKSKAFRNLSLLLCLAMFGFAVLLPSGFLVRADAQKSAKATSVPGLDRERSGTPGSSVRVSQDAQVISQSQFLASCTTPTLSEGFDNINTLVPAGWALINNSQPLGTTDWFQGDRYQFLPGANGRSQFLYCCRLSKHGERGRHH